MKLISVAILAHGGPGHLSRAIDSLVAQTYKNIEVIVVYDSPDDTVIGETIRPYGDKIKYYQKDDDGVASALNFAVRKSTGQYFSWLSQDDIYPPEKLEEQITAIGDRDDLIAVSNWEMVNRNNRRVLTYTVDHVIEKHPSCFFAFAKGAQLNTCAMLFPAAMLKKQEFNNSFPSSRDYKMLNSMVMAGAAFKVVSKPLLSYAAHSEDRYLSDSRINDDYDFVHSNLIESLSYDAVLAYFGDRGNIVRYYNETLDSGRSRSAAFLMQKIIAGALEAKDYEAAKETLLNDLSGLAESQMAANADILTAKMVKPGDKKKILFCSAHWLTGGMERVMAILFRELRNDYEIFLITPYDERKSHIDIPDFVTSIKISNDLFVKHFDSLILTYALLLDIDVATGFINLFDKQLNFYNICAGTKIKTIASNHEYYFYPYRSPTHYGVVKKRLDAYKKCDAIVWPNSFNAALCGMYVANNYVIGNPNNFEIVQEVSSTKENVIICVGRFDDYVKRIDRILQCFSLVLQKVPDAKLVLVGKYDLYTPIKPGDHTTVNDIINELAIPSGNLSFIGEVNNVQDYYATAKVLMLTSNSEGFGMVLNEAACFGVPSVCNYIPGIEDIIVNGENGYITEQGDINSMAQKVSDILGDNALQETLGSNAKKKAKTYDSKHIGNKWRYLIDSLVEIRDKDNVRKKLNSKLGYVIPDQQLFSRVLAREVNEIFYVSVKESGQYRIASGTLLVLSKITNLPGRIRANIAYEGLPKTTSKIMTRSYRVARNKLKI